MKLSRKSILTAIMLSTISTTSWGSAGSKPDTDLEAIDLAIATVRQNITTSDCKGLTPLSYSLVSHNEEGLKCVITQTNNRLGPILEGERDTHFCLDAPAWYFAVTKDPENPLAQIFYTRLGDFAETKDGYLKNTGDYFLLGWKVDDDSLLETSLTLVNTRTLATHSEKTTEIEMRVNFSADASIGHTLSIHSRVVDTLFIEHAISFLYTKVEAFEWRLTIEVPDAKVDGITQIGDVTSEAPYANMLIQFDGSGRVLSYNGIEGIPPALRIQWDATAAQDSEVKLNFGDVDGEGVPRDEGYIPTVYDLPGNGFLDIPYLENFIPADGRVFSVFRNGERKQTFDIALATFPAINHLGSQSGSAFLETKSSGERIFRKANDPMGSARIYAGKLEGNPTDVEEELKKLDSLQSLKKAILAAKKASSE